MNANILVVDDDKSIRNLTERVEFSQLLLSGRWIALIILGSIPKIII